jgi:hypothetical protein
LIPADETSDFQRILFSLALPSIRVANIAAVSVTIRSESGHAGDAFAAAIPNLVEYTFGREIRLRRVR